MQIFSKRLHNGYWLASLIILSGLTAWVYYSGEDSGKDYDESMFTLEANSVITTVQIKRNQDELLFDYINGSWIVNNSFEMDPGMRDAFFTVVSSIRIRRPVSNTIRDSIQNYLKEDGLKVEIRNNSEVIKEYLVGGDEISGTSYFMDDIDQLPYEVVLPGYESYVAGIFSVPTVDWRNRFLFEFDWSNLKSVAVDYANERSGFAINYMEDFFYLNDEQEPIDSALMFDYIGELRNLQVQSYMEVDESNLLDSLSGINPMARIKVEVIGETEQVLEIYEIAPGEQWVLARFGENLLARINPRALSPILLETGDWE